MGSTTTAARFLAGAGLSSSEESSWKLSSSSEATNSEPLLPESTRDLFSSYSSAASDCISSSSLIAGTGTALALAFPFALGANCMYQDEILDQIGEQFAYHFAFVLRRRQLNIHALGCDPALGSTFLFLFLVVIRGRGSLLSSRSLRSRARFFGFLFAICG